MLGVDFVALPNTAEPFLTAVIRVGGFFCSSNLSDFLGKAVDFSQCANVNGIALKVWLVL